MQKCLYLYVAIILIISIIVMLFEGQGNVEERPEYQIMIKRKRSHIELLLICLLFSVILIR